MSSNVMASSSRRFDFLSWPEAYKAAQIQGSTLIWPFGACEQHGPHLPLATDSFFAEEVLVKVLERLPNSCPVWRLPVQALGFSPEHASFPGTISMPANWMLQLVMEVGEQMASIGINRLLLFNAHGGQIGLLQAAARELHLKCPEMGIRKNLVQETPRVLCVSMHPLVVVKSPKPLGVLD